MKSIGLVGFPNVGKSTLFNELTGASARVVNYPGSTVEAASGVVVGSRGESLQIWDLPGVYTLSGVTEEEKVARTQALACDALVLVCDVTQAGRQAQWVDEVRGLGKPFVVVFTMQDLWANSGLSLPRRELEALLGARVLWKQEWLEALVREDFLDLWLARGSSLSSDSREFLQQWRKLWQPAEMALAQVAESFTIKWDRWLLQGLTGWLVFAGVLLSLFLGVFTLSEPISGFLDSGFVRLGEWVESREFWGADFLAKALLPAMASLVVFVPQIFLLFFFMALLEGSGYLARASVLADQLLRRFGLSGRAFVSLLSGYGCAIGGILATRTMASAEEKRLVRWMLPLLTCSARVPVFVVLIQALLPEASAVAKALVLMGLYLVSFVISLVAAAVVQRVSRGVAKTEPSWLAMDLPWYRLPSLSQAFQQGRLQAWSFVRRAGPVISGLSLVLFILAQFPSVEASYLKTVAAYLEPVFTPMGSGGDLGVAILASFIAREVFVGTLASMRALAEDDVVAISSLFSAGQAAALLVFFVFALQCVSTLGVLVKEGHGLKQTLLQAVVYNGLAYVLGVLVYQSLRMFGV